jgi:hypothetical protein
MMRPARISIIRYLRYENIVVEIPADEEQVKRSSTDNGNSGAISPTTTTKHTFVKILMHFLAPIAGAAVWEVIRTVFEYPITNLERYTWVCELAYKTFRNFCG